MDVLAERPYVCSYVGADANQLIGFDVSTCYISRKMESIGEYFQVVSDSDLSLCPGGLETHRIYEAFSLGSVPVVFTTPDSCGLSSIRWLQQFKAPLVVVESPDQFLQLLDREKKLNAQEKIARRAGVVNWYSDFRRRNGHKFLSVLKLEH